MTAATEDRTATRKVPPLRYPVVATLTIYKGTMVCLDADGYATPAADTAGLSGVVGIAMETRTGGSSSGDTSIRVDSGKAFLVNATSVTQAMLGRMMYVVDDNVVEEDGGTSVDNHIPAGNMIEFVSTTSCYISIPVGGGTQIRASVKSA